MSVIIPVEPRHISRLNVQFANGATVEIHGVKIADITSGNYTLDFRTVMNRIISTEITNPTAQTTPDIFLMIINNITGYQPAAYYQNILTLPTGYALDGSSIEGIHVSGAADPTAVTYSLEYI